MADITDDLAELRYYADNMAAARMEQVADRIRRVLDECERLRTEITCDEQRVADLMADVDRLSKECERLRADAARLDSGAILFRQRNEMGEPAECLYVRVDLRAAIDAAAMQEQPK